MADKEKEALEKRISKALKSKMQLSSLDIHVDVQDDRIILSGFVDTLAEKSFAQSIVNQLQSEKAVENDLTISTDGTLTNDEIQSHVEKHLRESKYSDHLKNVGVQVKGGSAVLMGQVHTLSDKAYAMKMAEKAAGVKDVVSNIQIIPSEEALEFTDDKVTSKVAQLLSTSAISVPDISLRTQRGEVTMKGYVNNQYMLETAESLAASVEGVKKVNNLLQIRQKD